MNLLDIIELQRKREVPVAEYQPIKTKINKLERFLEGMSSGPSNLRNTPITLQIERKESIAISAMKKNFVLQYGVLGETNHSLSNKQKRDLWDRLSESPKTNTSNLRKLCDALGFIIIPFDYLNPLSYQNESAELRKEILEFSSQKEVSVYVLCPVMQYSVHHHIHSGDIYKPIYAGRHSQAFLSLQMSIPFLKSIVSSVDAVRGRVNVIESRLALYDSRLSFAEENIKSMSIILRDLQAQVEEQQKELALQKISLAINREQIKEILKAHLGEVNITESFRVEHEPLIGLNVLRDARDARMFCVDDPLLFMVDEKIDPRSGHDIAFIGPCWGQDFDENALLATDLSEIKGQRKSLEKIIKQLWSK